MNYREQIVQGEFLARPNRFIAHVRVNGEALTVHVKNTGRCRELLVPGATVYLAKAENPARKTPYDLIAVEKKCSNGQTLLINMDSQIPNAAAEEWLKTLPEFSPQCIIRREVTHRNSRFDFMIRDGKRTIYVEVKGVTLERNGLALFPDAPTERGARHLKELALCVTEDHCEAWVLFVIQMKGIAEFLPNEAMDPAFAEALRHAAANGVKIMAVDCIVTPDSITLDTAIPIRF